MRRSRDKGSKVRVANGVVSALVVVFFMMHGLLGSFSVALPATHPFMWVVWVGVGFVVVHVALSIATSYLQLTDAEFPPSARKRRHLALKWATGILLACAIAAHIACMRVPALVMAASFLPRAATVALSAALAWHICVGMKSLLKDVGLGRRLITPLRVAVCALALVFAVASMT